MSCEDLPETLIFIRQKGKKGRIGDRDGLVTPLLKLIQDHFPDEHPDKPYEASLLLFSLCTGAGASACAEIRQKDDERVVCLADSTVLPVSLRLWKMKGYYNEDTLVTVEGRPFTKSNLNVVYWLQVQIEQHFGLSLIQQSSWKEHIDLGWPLWSFGSDGMCARIQKRAFQACFRPIARAMNLDCSLEFRFDTRGTYISNRLMLPSSELTSNDIFERALTSSFNFHHQTLKPIPWSGAQKWKQFVKLTCDVRTMIAALNSFPKSFAYSTFNNALTRYGMALKISKNRTIQMKDARDEWMERLSSGGVVSDVALHLIDCVSECLTVPEQQPSNVPMPADLIEQMWM
ncbi:hypothetical protein BLNAU_3616 [Blattamonas nauphoetae]|uniref:Uncharacterized protein n=1 Tax=Blattamonas nauphoetae TaxID=2049346 RepID=A0ABQ9YCP0_9EUKA|nr:hypothetical protein BLNAU_3616 [Blattamonas nauphoetae]